MGKDENALTRSLGLLLSYNKDGLRVLLKLFGIKNLREKKLSSVNIRCQKGHGKFGVTDLEIELDEDFLIIVEAKLNSIPNHAQMKKYAQYLLKKRKTYNKVKLVLLTRRDERDFYSSCMKEPYLKQLNGEEFLHLKWEELITNLYDAFVTNSNKQINQDMWNFIWRYSMPVEVIVFPEEDPGRFNVYKKNRFYPIGRVEANTKKIPMYVALYTFQTEYDEFEEPEIKDTISYIGKVESVSVVSGKELEESYSEECLSHGFMKEIDYTRLHVGEFMKLRNPIKKRKRRFTKKGYETDFAKLLAAEYTDEL